MCSPQRLPHLADPDAQLHSHFVVANVTQIWRQSLRVTEVEMLSHFHYAGKVYQNEMAHAVQSLGYGIELAKDSKGRITGFEIAGVTAEMRERQSTRSIAIEAAARDFAQKHGREPSAAERRVLTLESRGNKLVASSKEANEEAQRSKYTASELQELEQIKENEL
jgi:conjugative relaxase-like TrwC/TraI family protein